MRALFVIGLALATAGLWAAEDMKFAAVVKDAKGEAVPDAVISLYALDRTDDALPADDKHVEISQQGQEYVPYVTVIRAGTKVDFPNKDEIQHHIYSVSKAKRFEKPLYAPGAHETVIFDQPGIVTLGCNIHDWMIAYIVVLPTSHFAKTDAKGAATITTPPGRYRVEIWHPRLAKPVQEEIFWPNGSAVRDYTLNLRADRRIRRASESKPSGY